MPKPKYIDLNIADLKDLPAHSLAGYVIVSDYRSDGIRHLFLRKEVQVGKIQANQGS